MSAMDFRLAFMTGDNSPLLFAVTLFGLFLRGFSASWRAKARGMVSNKPLSAFLAFMQAGMVADAQRFLQFAGKPSFVVNCPYLEIAGE